MDEKRAAVAGVLKLVPAPTDLAVDDRRTALDPRFGKLRRGIMQRLIFPVLALVIALGIYYWPRGPKPTIVPTALSEKYE